MSLSEKMESWIQPIDRETRDIREAVKELKGRIIKGISNTEKFKIIDEIFGDKLTNG